MQIDRPLAGAPRPVESKKGYAVQKTPFSSVEVEVAAVVAVAVAVENNTKTGRQQHARTQITNEPRMSSETA